MEVMVLTVRHGRWQDAAQAAKPRRVPASYLRGRARQGWGRSGKSEGVWDVWEVDEGAEECSVLQRDVYNIGCIDV